MAKTVILVGYLPSLLPALDAVLPDVDVVIIEDPDLATRVPVQKALAESARRRLSPWEYPRSATADAWYHLHRDLDVVAVLPAVEYAIVFAARLAERYGVAGATHGAATLMRDKSLLREATRAAGVRNPAFAPVETFAQVAEFAAAHPGPLVLKPTNRQASVGTVIVPDPAGLAAAWDLVRQQEETVYIAYRHLPLRLQVEEYVDGAEFSVELLVRNGSVLFANVTGKLLYPGVRPVEYGHLVPADVPEETTTRLVEATTHLIGVIGFDTGVVHCEWIVRDGEPYLVECTGRLPGDGIVHLIEHAYPIELVRRYVVAMLGGTSDPAPRQADMGAATLFPLVPAGTVTEVEGMAEAAAVPGIYVCLCSVKPGDRVNELRSSWDRVFGVAACADTTALALAAAQESVAKVRIHTVPEAAVD
jgi:biotin carboxylase